MSKHTPGPWQNNGEVKDRFCRIYDAQHRLVATVPYGSARNPSKAATPDAMLIAAAPELLESLKLAKLCIEAMIEDGRCGETFVGAALTLDKINFAIAQAEGGQ